MERLEGTCGFINKLLKTLNGMNTTPITFERSNEINSWKLALEMEVELLKQFWG
jgi:hypothetical protein